MFSICYKKNINNNNNAKSLCFTRTITKRVDKFEDVRYKHNIINRQMQYDNHIKISFLCLRQQTGPEYIKYFNNGQIFFQTWSIRHEKNDCPTFVEYDRGGNIVKETWEKGKGVDRVLHREGGPSIITYYRDGAIKSESWCFRGAWHRLEVDSPSFVQYDEDGYKISEAWYRNGELGRGHNIGPATLIYDEWEKIHKECWYVNNVLHRENGPAVTVFCDDGSIQYREWFTTGKLVACDLQNGKVHHFI